MGFWTARAHQPLPAAASTKVVFGDSRSDALVRTAHIRIGLREHKFSKYNDRRARMLACVRAHAHGCVRA